MTFDRHQKMIAQKICKPIKNSISQPLYIPIYTITGVYDNDENGRYVRISFNTPGKNAIGIIEPERKPTIVFFSIFEPQRFLNMNAVKPKQMLKQKLIA